MVETRSLPATKKRAATSATTARKSGAADGRAAQIKSAWDQWRAANRDLWEKFALTLQAFYRAETAHLNALEARCDVQDHEAAKASAYAALVEVSGVVDMAMKPMLEAVERLERGRSRRRSQFPPVGAIVTRR